MPRSELEVVLPWPPPDLSPNARLHWSKAAKVKRRYRKTCWGETALALSRARKANVRMWCAPDQRLRVELQFFPPNRRSRDIDNLVASMKAGIDGIADALGIDDSNFELGEPKFGACGAGSCVKVRLVALEGTNGSAG